MPKKKQSAIEKFLSLSDAEKDAATAKYDRPLPVGRDGLPGRPLTAADKSLHRTARRAAQAKRGRPQIGAGAKIVPISIERGLLREADAFARRKKMKRSQLVADALRLLIARAG
jgi:hypothetical protein